MTAIAVTPTLSPTEKEGSIDSAIDEKLHLHDEELESSPEHPELVSLKAAALSDNVGDVYDNLRAIDLGADGKERPIGMLSSCLFTAIPSTDIPRRNGRRLCCSSDFPRRRSDSTHLHIPDVVSCSGIVLFRCGVGTNFRM